MTDLTGLARPAVSLAQATEVAERYWGLRGDVVELGSQEDRNFRVGGAEKGVLKFVHPATALAELQAQALALRELAAVGLTVPVTVPSRGGADIEQVDVDGTTLHTRVLSYVDGAPLIDREAFGVEEARLLGDTAGRIAAALAEFRHPGTVRRTQWDLRVAGDVIADGLRYVPAAHRDAVGAAREAALRRLGPVAESLPLQVIHADVTDDNVVLDEHGTVGVIDFGDLQLGWRVAELAATCAAILMRGDDPGLMLATVRAFATHVPLTGDELAALFPLVVLRTAVLVVCNHEQSTLDGEDGGNDGGNDYVGERRAAEWRSFRVATSWDADELEVLVRAAAGDVHEPVDVGRLLPAGCVPAVVDLSPVSPELDEGAWLVDGTEERILRAAAGHGGAATTRWGEYRLTRARPLAARDATATFALGVDLVLPAGTELTAPFDGRVEGRTLRGEHLSLHLTGLDTVTTDTEVRQGEPLGTAERVTVQLSAVDGVRPPFFVTPRAEATWCRISPDPAPLLGIAVAAGPTTRTDCSPGATPRSPASRSTTTAARRASNVAGASTSSTRRPRSTSTASTTSPCSATPTRASSPPSPASGRCSTPTRDSTTGPSPSCPSASPRSRRTGWTRSSSSTAAARPSTWRCGSR